MLGKVKVALQQTNPAYNLLFLGLHYYYEMELISFGYNRDFNVLLQFPVYVKLYTQKPLALYQIGTVPVPI